MTHPRHNIRAAVVLRLTGKTAAESRVFPSRVRPVDAAQLPCILVYAGSEAVTVYQESPHEYERRLTVQVEAQAKADEGLDAAMDAIAEDVEHELMQDHTLGGLCRDVELTASEITIKDDGDTLIGSCVLTYEVTYHTYAVADSEEPDVSDLKKIHAGWDQPDHVPGELDAEDEIDFEEGT